MGPNGVDCTVPANVNATHACLIDGVLGCATATCVKGAYTYSLAKAGAVANADYFIGAWPVSSAGGNKRFCSLTDAVVKTDSVTVTTAPVVADCSTGGTMKALSN